MNKTETAVRATHLPTGIVAIAQDGRSQYENRQLAMERLKRRVQVGNEKAQNDARARLRYKHDNVERGNPGESIFWSRIPFDLNCIAKGARLAKLILYIDA